MKTHDIAIIGAGPAGISAAIQLHRFGLDYLILEGNTFGGLLNNANLVENYPGFPGGITGPDLVEKLDEQTRSLGINVAYSEVLSVQYKNDKYHIRCNDEEYSSTFLIIASGTKPITFTDFEIPPNLQQQIYYEVQSLTSLTDSKVVIAGGGDAAFDYALNLARRNEVIILNRNSAPACLRLLQERANRSNQITYHGSTSILHIEETDSGEIELFCESYGGKLNLKANILIGAIGRIPQCDFLPANFLSSASNLELKGLLYWIGDVRNGIERQVAIAAGDGIRAAMKVFYRLKEM
jgi:thioredoxin reductase